MVKNNSTKKSKIIILIALVLVLVGIVIFVILYRPGGVLSQNVQEGIDTNEPAQPGAQNPTSPDEPKDVTLDKRYLVLEDWGVQFIIPEGLEGIRYYKVNGTGGRDDAYYYEFTTERVELLGGQCREPAEHSVPGVIRLVSVSRYTSKLDLGNRGSQPALMNEENTINGYYYYRSTTQSDCRNNDDSEASAKLLRQDVLLLESMIQTITPIK